MEHADGAFLGQSRMVWSCCNLVVRLDTELSRSEQARPSRLKSFIQATPRIDAGFFFE